jgi:hypothetical protein
MTPIDEDPPRLFDSADAPDALKRALGAAHADVPDAARLHRIADGIASKIGPGGGGGGGGSTGAGTAMKMMGAGVIAVIAIGGVYLATRSPTPVSPPPTPAVSIAAPSSAPAPVVAPPPSASEATLPAIDFDALPRPSAAPRASVTAALSAETGPSEIELLRQAQDALSSSPAQSLALCSDHARRFPRGMLGQEREVIAIDALLRSGRRAEAEARAAQFVKAFPGSAHARRIETLLGRR